MRGRIALCVLLALATAGASPGAQPFEQMLPEGTTFFLSVRGLRDFEKAVKSLGLADLWNDPEMRPFAKGVEDLLGRAMADMKRELGFTLTDLQELCQGEVAVAFGDPASIDPRKKEAPLALLIDVGDRKDKAREFIRKSVELSKLRKRETEFRGTTIITLEDPKKDEKGADAAAELSMTLAEEVLAVGFSRPYLQDILAGRADSSLKTLDDHADFKFLRERHGKDGWFFLYAHTGRWLAELPRIIQVSGGGGAAVPVSGLVTRVVSDIVGLGGFRAFSWASFHRDPAEEGTFFVIQSGPPRGFFKFFSAKPQPLRFPSVIPRDAREAHVLLVDWNGLLSAIEEALKMAKAFMPIPAGEGEEGIFQEIEKELGIRIQEDLIGPLGARFVILNGAPRVPGEDEYAVLIELKDKERIEGALRKVLAKTPMERKEYLGHSLWVVPAGEAAAEDLPEFALCISDAHLVISTTRLVEEIVRREGKEVESVNEAPGLKALASRIPSTTTLLSHTSPVVIEDAIAYLKTMSQELEDVLGGDEDLDGDDDTARDDAPASPPEREEAEQYFEELGKLLLKLPSGKGLSKHVAGSISWSFIEDRGFGVQTVYGRRAADSR